LPEVIGDRSNEIIALSSGVIAPTHLQTQVAIEHALELHGGGALRGVWAGDPAALRDHRL
jgi:hypothetical protein